MHASTTDLNDKGVSWTGGWLSRILGQKAEQPSQRPAAQGTGADPVDRVWKAFVTGSCSRSITLIQPALEELAVVPCSSSTLPPFREEMGLMDISDPTPQVSV